MMSRLVRQSVSLILMLVFTSVGVLSAVGEPVMVDPLNPLEITADASSCCTDTAADSCCCCDEGEASSCCPSNDANGCAHCDCVHVSGSLSPLALTDDGLAITVDCEFLTDMPAENPVEGTLKPIEHIPILSIS